MLIEVTEEAMIFRNTVNKYYIWDNGINFLHFLEQEGIHTEDRLCELNNFIFRLRSLFWTCCTLRRCRGQWCSCFLICPNLGMFQTGQTACVSEQCGQAPAVGSKTHEFAARASRSLSVISTRATAEADALSATAIANSCLISPVHKMSARVRHPQNICPCRAVSQMCGRGFWHEEQQVRPNYRRGCVD